MKITKDLLKSNFWVEKTVVCVFGFVWILDGVHTVGVGEFEFEFA